jgi:hypothetical protein
VDCPLEIATKRGMERDRKWGNDYDSEWLTIWKPNEQDFLDKYHPDKLADFIYSSK